MKKYTNVYMSIRDMILNGELKAGEKAPSIRKATELFGVSRTTILSAYFDLCADGYIIAKEKSGYYVAQANQIKVTENTEDKAQECKYNLIGGTADSHSFDFTLWQRYIKSALRQKERLLSYGEVQGEYDLRSAISSYIREKRNVITSPDKIVIGAGVLPLLQVLSSILEKDNVISFPDDSFYQGIGLFRDNGFRVHTRDKDADIIYVSPSHMTRWGDVMPISRRLELVEYSKKRGSIVIEDDYESDFLYNTKPTPSLYALGSGNIVYLGSFSSMLLPGIRISFMVLNDELLQKYRQNSFRYAQTASKTEQIALAQYIRDGHINSQIRKIRRLYTAKTKALALKLNELMSDADIEISENNLQIILKSEFNKNISVFKENELDVFIKDCSNKCITLVISPSAIPNDEIENVARLLKKSISS